MFKRSLVTLYLQGKEERSERWEVRSESVKPGLYNQF